MYRFRWVECQFEALKRCPGSLRNLEKCLQSLPRSLDETYERMLCSIDENSVPEARRILTLLCYSARPLKVSELIDGIAVDLNEPAGLNLDARLQSIEDIYDICPGLIEITDEKHEKLVNETQNIYEDVRVPTARIAHFSVREYLESSRIREQQAAKFALESTTAHSEVAHICVVYLQTDDLIQEQSELSIHDNFPLAEYAAKSWVGHYRDCQRLLPQLDNHVRQLLERKDTVAAWRRLYIRGWDFIDLKDNDVELDGVASSAYYASFLGLDQLLRKLMNEMKVSGGVHATCGELALYVASHFDHSRVVEMWLDAGTDVNSNNGAPLSIAAFFGHERTVRVLLDAGADVNLSTGRFLILAVCRGHEKIIQMLLDAGADVNSNNGASLLAAVMLSRGMIVKMLLDAGADANFQAVSAAPELLVFLINGFALDLLTDHLTGNEDEEFDTDHRFPYPTGTPENHEKVAKMLLDVGVDVNRANYVPFLEACYTSRVGFLEAFEDMGYSESAIDNNCSDPFGGKVSNLLWRTGNPDNETALSFAAIRGSEKIVQLLLDAGADANSDNGAPLSEAAAQGNTKVVKLLLDAGANRCCLDDRPLEERAGYYVDSDSEW